MALGNDPKRHGGWQRRNVAAEPRLGEAVALYRSLGFEVRLVPVSDDEPGACTACFGAGDDPSRYQVIYTRPAAEAEGDVPPEPPHARPERKAP